jgi:GMP synthase-like glutamine amidotransferase
MGTVAEVRGLLIGNATDSDAGFVGAHLRRRGFDFTEGRREQPGAWPDLDGVELVLTLGSEWHVYDPATAAAVAAEAALVRLAGERGIPVLAICFGAQVLSHALGGTVRRLDAPEIGWFELAVETPDVATGPWMEWHSDGFTPPEGFDVLARTDAGPQLIRGRRALGTQFHPEVTEAMVTRWIEHGGADQYRRHDGDPDALLAETRANVVASGPAAEALVDWFLDGVAGA